MQQLTFMIPDAFRGRFVIMRLRCRAFGHPVVDINYLNISIILLQQEHLQCKCSILYSIYPKDYGLCLSVNLSIGVLSSGSRKEEMITRRNCIYSERLNVEALSKCRTIAETTLWSLKCFVLRPSRTKVLPTCTSN